MIVTVSSWRGAGATTTALLLAHAFAERGPVWLVEADPAGGVLAGRIHVAPHALGGLERVAFPVDGAPAGELLDEVSHGVGELRIVTTPADPFRAHACHQPRLPWVPALRDLDGDVVVDAGRLRAGSVALPLLLVADVVVMVTSPEVGAAVGTAEWLAAGGRVAPNDESIDAADVTVVAVDQPCGVGFARPALAAEFGRQWGGWLAWEPAAVDLVHRGADLGDRRLRRSELVDGVRHVAADLADRVAPRVSAVGHQTWTEVA